MKIVTEKGSIVFTAAVRYRWNLAFGFLHLLLTALFLIVLTIEGLDQATGEDKFGSSGTTLWVASIGLKVFLFPLGFLMFLNTSMALVFVVLNSLFIGFTPVWFRWLKERWRRPQRGKGRTRVDGARGAGAASRG